MLRSNLLDLLSEATLFACLLRAQIINQLLLVTKLVSEGVLLVLESGDLPLLLCEFRGDFVNLCN